MATVAYVPPSQENTHSEPPDVYTINNRLIFISLLSESVLVKSVANYGVCHGRMLSGLGRNVQTCCEHFSLSTSMLLGMPPSYLSDVLLGHSMQHYSVIIIIIII